MIETNLKDAHVRKISAQGRYEFGYNAARLMTTALIRASGYRVVARTGHHYFTFPALKASDPCFASIAIYFDKVRSTRNEFSYDTPVPISETDALDLNHARAQFIIHAEKWISKHDPTLSR